MSARRVVLAAALVWAGYQFLPSLLDQVGLHYADPGSASMFSPNSIAVALVVAIALSKFL